VILYLDTSALIKLYVQEEGSHEVRAATAKARVVAASRLAYVEARAALARACRESRIDPSALQQAVHALQQDWPKLFVIEASAEVAQHAGELAQAHALRAYDALQLASALVLRRRVDTDVRFLSFDVDLTHAARAAGLV
jgi:uncharacterized protein